MRRCNIREGVAFTLFLLSMAAMDSDMMYVPGTVCILSVLALLWMAERNGPVKREAISEYKYLRVHYRAGKGGTLWDTESVHTVGLIWIRTKNVTAGLKLRRRNKKRACQCGLDRLGKYY